MQQKRRIVAVLRDAVLEDDADDVRLIVRRGDGEHLFAVGFLERRGLAVGVEGEDFGLDDFLEQIGVIRLGTVAEDDVDGFQIAGAGRQHPDEVGAGRQRYGGE